MSLAAVVSESGRILVNPDVTPPDVKGWMGLAVREKEQEARHLREIYGGDTAAVRGRTAIIIDDGMITGLTMSLAVQEVRRLEPERIVVAVPASTAKAIEKLRPLADATATLVELSDGIQALANSYARFKPVSDHFVVKTLRTFRLQAERSAS